MRKVLLLLPLIALLAACQKEAIDSKRICALQSAGVLETREAAIQLGILEPMTQEEFWEPKVLGLAVGQLVKYCSHYID